MVGFTRVILLLFARMICQEVSSSSGILFAFRRTMLGTELDDGARREARDLVIRRYCSKIVPLSGRAMETYAGVKAIGLQCLTRPSYHHQALMYAAQCVFRTHSLPPPRELRLYIVRRRLTASIATGGHPVGSSSASQRQHHVHSRSILYVVLPNNKSAHIA